MSVIEKCGRDLKLSKNRNITPPSRTANQTIEIAKSQPSRRLALRSQNRRAALFTMCRLGSPCGPARFDLDRTDWSLDCSGKSDVALRHRALSGMGTAPVGWPNRGRPATLARDMDSPR